MIVKEFKTEILEQDLTTYKIVDEGYQDNTIISWCMGFIYTFGVLYKTQIQESYDTLFFDFKEDEAWDSRERMYIGEGFHSSLTPDRYKNKKGLIVECTVPKGSEVIHGRTNLLVSNQIIINKIL